MRRYALLLGGQRQFAGMPGTARASVGGLRYYVLIRGNDA
jgi:hypothetical protein